MYSTDDGLLEVLRLRLEAAEKQQPAGADAARPGEAGAPAARDLHIVIRRR